MTFEVRFTRSAKRALTNDLPEKVATAVWTLVMGDLRDNPQRVGEQLKAPLYPLYSARRGEYRVIYRIVDDILAIEIVATAHRRDSYR